MTNICLVAYGGGHAAMLVPVIKVLKQNENIKLSVLALTTAGSVMENHNIDYVSYKDFTYLADESFAEKGSFLVGEQSASSVISYDESVAYHGINYLDLVEQYGEVEASNKYKLLGRQAFYPINFMKCLLTELDVDLLIATNSPRTERAAIDAAGELQLKSLCLIDMFALQEVKWVGKKGYASKLCVLNQSVKDMFLDVGRSANEIEITGNPAFDSLTSIATISSGKQLKEARGWHESNLITLFYASQPEPSQHPFTSLSGDPELPRNIENTLREFVSKHTRFRLVIRYHPSENVEFTAQERVLFSPQEDNLHSLLYGVDIVVVTASTVGLEASLIGKKVISVDNSIFTDDAPFSRMGISEGVTEAKELEKKILDVSQNLDTQVEHIQYLNSTGNVVKVVERLIFEMKCSSKISSVN